MVIGLYDIDFWKAGHYPNLELMKIFHYYWNKGDIVNFLKPDERDLGRYSHIYYFKNNLKSKMPENIDSSKSTFYGEGFYGEVPILKPEVAQLTPMYLPYDDYPEKYKKNKAKYRALKQGSYIRIETQDFADLKPEQKKIFFADSDLVKQEKALEFVEQYKDGHTFSFARGGGHRLYSEEQFKEWLPYKNQFLNAAYDICFDFNEDFLIKYIGEKNINWLPIIVHKDSTETYILKLINLILWNKHLSNKPINFYTVIPNNELIKKLLKWNTSKKQDCYYDLFEEDELSKPYHYLLEKNPQFITEKDIDFSLKV